MERLSAGTGLSSKRDTGTERPVFIHVVGGTQRDAVSIVETLVLIEQRLAVAAGSFQLLELAPAGVCQAIVDRPLWRNAVITGDFPHISGRCSDSEPGTVWLDVPQGIVVPAPGTRPLTGLRMPLL